MEKVFPIGATVSALKLDKGKVPIFLTMKMTFKFSMEQDIIKMHNQKKFDDNTIKHNVTVTKSNFGRNNRMIRISPILWPKIIINYQ